MTETLTAVDASRDSAMRVRVRAEFQEMPGMRLTVAQAARLFALEAAECARVLRSLVDEGTLRTDGWEYFRENREPHRTFAAEQPRGSRAGVTRWRRA
jgi:hypothetical protein